MWRQHQASNNLFITFLVLDHFRVSHQPINNEFGINIKSCSGRCVSHSFSLMMRHMCERERNIYSRAPKTQDQKGHHCLLIMFSSAPFVLRSKAPPGSTMSQPHLGLRLSPRVMLRSTFKGNLIWCDG